MFRISPINYGSNNYHLVKDNKKVKPVDKINNDNNNKCNSDSNNKSNNDSDFTNFQLCLEEEIQKLKRVKKNK